MSTFTVANRPAGGGRVGTQWDRISRAIIEAYGLGEVVFTDHVGHGIELTKAALTQGATRVVVVGGDGTINEAVNGYMAAGGASSGAELALYPLGTGGDLARSLGLKGASPDGLIRGATARTIDVGRLVATTDEGETERYFLNIASTGVTGAVVDKVNQGSKRFGAKSAFIWGAVRGFTSYRPQRVRVRIDDAVEEELDMTLIAVANGRYFGGGMKITPGAYLDDGVFQVCVVGGIGLTKFLRNAPKLYRGEHGVLPGVRFFDGKTATVQPVGDQPVVVEADGEVAGTLPARFEIIPGGARVLAPWSSSEAIRS